MFSYLKMKNFKSFVSFNANFQSKANNPKNMICIYGENGSGKSNLIYSFMFLKNTLDTLNSQKILQELLSEKKDEVDLKTDEQNLKLLFNKRYKQLEQL